MLPKPRMLAGFTLQEVGGPPIDERADASGLFSDGRFLDFSDSKNALGQAGNFQNREQNRLHSVSVTDDGERVYVAGTTAGFYVLDSEGVARMPSNAQLAAGTAGCNRRSTIVSVNGAIDAGEAAGAGQRLPAHGRQRRSGTQGVSGIERLARGEGAAVPGAAHALALRRLPAGERATHGHAQRRLRARPSRSRPWQHEGPACVRVAVATRTAAVRSTTRGWSRWSPSSCRSWWARSRFPTTWWTSA